MNSNILLENLYKNGEKEEALLLSDRPAANDKFI